MKGIPIEKINLVSNYDLSSDHSPLLMTMSSSVLQHSPPPKLSNKMTDWENFHQVVHEKLIGNMPLENSAQIDEAVEHLITTIQTAAWESIPPDSFVKSNTCLSYFNPISFTHHTWMFYSVNSVQYPLFLIPQGIKQSFPVAVLEFIYFYQA